jgi:hypothetical protein
MGGTELKTDSFKRWMMYSKDTYGSGRIFLTREQKQAVEEGREYSRRAYANVWAKDAALVQRVRLFLGTNFYWHQRLAKNGADLDVVQTLQSMIRGESVVLIAEQSRTDGAGSSPAPKPETLPSFRESLMTRHGMSYEAATAYIDWYDNMVDKVNAYSASLANRAVTPLADTASDMMAPVTPLGDAQAFEYISDALSDDVEELAKSTMNERYAARMLGYDMNTFGGMIHALKHEYSLRGDDNVIFHDSGDVYFNGEWLDNIHTYAP